MSTDAVTIAAEERVLVVTINRPHVRNAIDRATAEGIAAAMALASARVLAFGIIGMVNWTNRWFVPDRSPVAASEVGAAYAELVVAGLRR